MHPSPLYRWDDDAALAFVAEMSFAHVFAQTPDGPRVAHVPVIVDGQRLRFHLANANALTPHLAGLTALASVAGPNAYVSPNWYVKRTRVPTWLYVAVECEGPVRALSPAELVDLLDASTATHEGRVAQNWTRAKMDPAKFAAMCRAITGFQLTVTAVRATRKLIQDSDATDAAAVVASVPDADVAALVRDARA